MSELEKPVGLEENQHNNIVTETIPDNKVISEKVPEEISVKTEPPKAKVIQTQEMFKPAEKWDDNNETLHLPAGNIAKVLSVINDGPNVSLDDSKSGRDWASSLQESTETLQIRGVYDRTVSRENAEFHQVIDSDKMPLAGTSLY